MVRATFQWLRRALAVPVCLVVIWWLVTDGSLIDPIFLPSPFGLWTAFEAMAPELPAASASSVSMTLAGYVLGAVIGLTLGLAMAYSRSIRDLFGGLFDFLRPIPPFALIPLFVLWFGLGQGPQITIIAFGTAIIVVVITMDAVRNVPAVFIRAALVLGAGRGTIYRTVILPFITPHLTGALRAAAASAWGRDVAAEFIGAQTGLGYIQIQRAQYLDSAGIMVIIVIYSLLAITLDTLIVWLERPLTRWTGRHDRGGVAASILGST